MTERLSSMQAVASASATHDPKVIVPDVFPSQCSPIGMRDVIRGYVPSEADFLAGQAQGLDNFNTGWLRIAQKFKSIPAYLDPADPESKNMRRLYRPCQTLPIVVESVRDVERHSMRLSRALGVFRASYSRPDYMDFNGHKIRAETVRAFTAKVALNNSPLKLAGVHFPSGNQHGWVSMWQEH